MNSSARYKKSTTNVNKQNIRNPFPSHGHHCYLWRWKKHENISHLKTISLLPYNWSSNGKKRGVCCNAICKHGESIVQQRKSIYWAHAGSTTLEMVTTPQALLLFCYAISTPLRFHEMTAVEMKPWRYFCMQSLSWRAPIRGMYISQLEEQKKKK